MKRFIAILSMSMAIVGLHVSLALAEQGACPEHFAAGQMPAITNQKLYQAKIRLLCNQEYAVLHSGFSRTPLWAAEHLTAARLEQGRGLDRSNNFRADNRLPEAERSELSDYARSGFDRGHVSPSADFSSPAAQDESFLLSNMIPQDPNNNRNLHEGIESAVRAETRKRGELFVVTGPLFGRGSTLKALQGRVIIPESIFKCVYDQARHESGCYLEPNAPGMEYQVVSVQAVNDLAGFDIFPAAPAQVKATPMPLPEPRPHNKRGGGKNGGF